MLNLLSLILLYVISGRVVPVEAISPADREVRGSNPTPALPEFLGAMK